MKSIRKIIGLGICGLLSMAVLAAQEKEWNAKEAEVRAVHYWEAFDFTQVSLTPLEEEMESFIMDYLRLLNRIPQDRAVVHLQEMMHSAAADSTSFARMVEILEDFLTRRDSPVYNEELMKTVLRKALEEPVLGEVDKIRPTMLLELLSKNSVGTEAADFDCTFSDGSSRKMTDVVADYLLLFFYDPECDHCEATISALSASAEVKDYIGKNRLQILAVYPEEDIEAWRHYSVNLPDSWLNAYNASFAIRENELYDLMDTPTIYLLDKNHKVLRKNILPEKVVQELKKVLR